MATDPLSYFTKADHQELAAATTFIALRDIALRVLRRMPPRASMVCGPISTGGLGSVEKNLERFTLAIDLLVLRGENVFTQMPFEGPIQCVKEEEEGILLETFYRPLFASGRVATLCFLHDWRTSFGTRWEHERALEFGLERKYFKANFELLEPDESLFSE